MTEINYNNQPELWLAFAKLNPSRFKMYSGACACDWCRLYQADAQIWIKEQIDRSESQCRDLAKTKDTVNDSGSQND